MDEVVKVGVVHSRWMCFLERFMKTLKSFVRQRAQPEGSMAEGWLVQESIVYISEFPGRRDVPMPSSVLWHDQKEDERMTSEVPQGKGKDYKMDSTLEENINRFRMLNHPMMEKWIVAYDQERENRTIQRDEYKRTHTKLTKCPTLILNIHPV